MNWKEVIESLKLTPAERKEVWDSDSTQTMGEYACALCEAQLNKIFNAKYENDIYKVELAEEYQELPRCYDGNFPRKKAFRDMLQANFVQCKRRESSPST